jgi:hypothetical protein
MTSVPPMIGRGAVRRWARSFQSRLRRSLPAAAALALVATPAAVADETVQLAAGGQAIWTCSGAGVIELDAQSGRVLRRPIVGPDYPLQIALGSDAAWVAHVAGGYSAGGLTRIDLATGHMSTQLRLSTGPVFAVAAGAGDVWALVGPTAQAQIARVDPRSGRAIGFVRGAIQPTSLAADGSGLWIATGKGGRLHAQPSSSRARRISSVRPSVVDGLRGPPTLALGAGSAWLSGGATLLRVDERTGKPLARIRLPALPIATAVGPGTLWAIVSGRLKTAWLVRVSTSLKRITSQTSIPLASTSVAVGAGGVWLGVTSPRVLRVAPRTLKLHLLAQLL